MGESGTRASTEFQLARWTPWVFAALAAAAVWMWLRATGGEVPGWPGCLLRRFAHIDCPTCGMTRAFALLGRGDWRASLALQPWASVLLLQLPVAWVLWGRWLAIGGPCPDRWIPRAVAINGGALIVIWLVRLATGTLPT